MQAKILWGVRSAKCGYDYLAPVAVAVCVCVCVCDSAIHIVGYMHTYIHTYRPRGRTCYRFFYNFTTWLLGIHHHHLPDARSLTHSFTLFTPFTPSQRARLDWTRPRVFLLGILFFIFPLETWRPGSTLTLSSTPCVLVPRSNLYPHLPERG